MLISVISGMENFSAGASGSAFSGSVIVGQQYRSRPGLLSDVLLQQATRNPVHEVFEVGRPEQINAAQRNVHHGVWVVGRYHVKDGSCITLKIQRKKGGDIIYDTGLFLLSMREDAALRRLSIPFTGNPNATMSNGIIEGRFDLVFPEQFDSIGFVAPNISRSELWEQDPSIFFDEIVVEAETRQRPVVSVDTVTTPTGQIKVHRSANRRNIRIPTK